MQAQVMIGLIMIIAGVILTVGVIWNALRYRRREAEASRELDGNLDILGTP